MYIRCNTVPIEKGTETLPSGTLRILGRRCNTVPIEKGTETGKIVRAERIDLSDATPSPSRRGLKRNRFACSAALSPRCNTVPIEKGTETEDRFQVHSGRELLDATPSPSRRGLKLALAWSLSQSEYRCNTVPIEKGTETCVKIRPAVRS